MGRSRKERVVALTKTPKRFLGRDKKQQVVEEIRNCIDGYENVYVFSTENMRNSLLKKLRAEWRDSRFFFGRKRLMQVALGRTAEEEYVDGVGAVSGQLEGNVGLLMTNREHESVVKFFGNYCESEFARSGFKATARMEVKEGELEMFEVNQVTKLQQLGLPVEARKGKVWVRHDMTVCDVGETLTPEAAKVVELLGTRMAQFRVRLQCHFSKKQGSCQSL